MSEDPRDRTAVEASPTIAKRIVMYLKMLGLRDLIPFVESAGAPTEGDYDRNGFLSYHAETHALGMGIAAGWWYGATGSNELLSLVYGAAVNGRAHASNGKRRRILKDIVQEPHYSLGGVVLGAVLGTLTSRTGFQVIELAELVEQVPLVLTWVTVLA